MPTLPTTTASPPRRHLLVCGACAALVAGSGLIAHRSACAQTRPALLKAMAIYPSRSAASWPLWMAKHGGYFERYGIDADLRFAIHPSGMAAIVGGEAQFTVYGLEQVLSAVARDPTLVMTSSYLNKGAFALIGRGDVKSVKALKGKRIGVGRVGDPPYFYTLELLNRNGLASTHVQWVSTGTDSTARAAMLANGQIDAAMLTAPAYFRLTDQGTFTELANLLDQRDIPISTAIVFKKSFLATQPKLPEAVIKATAEAIKRFYDDKAFAIEAYRTFDPQISAADLERLYTVDAKAQVFDRIPIVGMQALKASAARLGDEIPAVKTLNFATVTDNSTVLRLISEGWFEKLFGPSVKAEQAAKLKDAA